MPKKGRFLIATFLPVIVTSVLFWPMANYKWTLYPVKPFDSVTGADPVFVAAPVADATDAVSRFTWRLFAAFPEVIGGALLAIALFTLVERKLGTGVRRETLCRNCKRVLRNLDRSECPACGVAL